MTLLLSTCFFPYLYDNNKSCKGLQKQQHKPQNYSKIFCPLKKNRLLHPHHPKLKHSDGKQKPLPLIMEAQFGWKSCIWLSGWRAAYSRQIPWLTNRAILAAEEIPSHSKSLQCYSDARRYPSFICVCYTTSWYMNAIETVRRLYYLHMWKPIHSDAFIQRSPEWSCR